MDRSGGGAKPLHRVRPNGRSGRRDRAEAHTGYRKLSQAAWLPLERSLSYLKLQPEDGAGAGGRGLLAQQQDGGLIGSIYG